MCLNIERDCKEKQNKLNVVSGNNKNQTNKKVAHNVEVITEMSNLVVADEAINDGSTQPDAPRNISEIVQKKFKDNEKVLLIFEAYQIVGLEHISCLLALVSSELGGTHAIFDLRVLGEPPRVKIENLFPLNENFQIRTDKKGSVSLLQFELQNIEEQSAPRQYYYYPQTTLVDFDTFYKEIKALHKPMTVIAAGEDTLLSYSWLNDYRQIGEVKEEMKRRANEYIVYKELRIYCATWNVNSRSSYESPLHLWLSACEFPPDIYAIGLQELDVNAKTVTFSESNPDRIWIHKMLQSVHPQEEYVELTSVRLVGMQLTLLIKRSLRVHVARCRMKTVARGIMKTLGNKGGVAVSLQLFEDNFCFINSHLAPHMNYVESRNTDYQNIVRGIIFDDDEQRNINNHDHIFWLGDLNYRIEEPPGWQWPISKDNEKAYDMLMPFDQLRQEMRKGNCFEGYLEGAIKFKPTYKYDVGTDNFDSSEKHREPAYCDRILYKGKSIKLHDYNSIMDIRQSDHKPVYATFTVKVKTKDEKKYKQVHEEVLKLVDKRENENQPQITVEKTVLDFGIVRFNELAVDDFIVSNSCAMKVYYTFKTKDPPLNAICEKWLKINPPTGSLMPDTEKRISIELMADYRSIRGLFQKIRTTNSKFDFDILILHVENGRDLFLTVTGEYKPSCFGLSVETLCRTNRPLCEYTQSQVKELMNDNTPEYRVTMPREFFLLIDYLHKQGRKIEGAFSTVDYKFVRHEQFNKIRDWLDTWSNDEFPGTPYAAAEALLLLLDLPEQPILDPFVEDLLLTTTTADAMEYISLLSSPKRNVFVHLCMFLREGIEQGYLNLYGVASTFGNVLLRTANGLNDSRRREFMNRFLCSDVGTLSDNVSTSVSAHSALTNLDQGAVGDNKTASSNLLS